METQKEEGETMDRREWLRFCSRGMLVAALSAGAARLVLRRQVPLAGQACANHGVCPSCARSSQCGLPAALSRRRALERHS